MFAAGKDFASVAVAVIDGYWLTGLSYLSSRGKRGNGPEDMARVVEFDGPLGLTAVAVAVVGCHDDGLDLVLVFLAVVVDGGAVLQLDNEDMGG